MSEISHYAMRRALLGLLPGGGILLALDEKANHGQVSPGTKALIAGKALLYSGLACDISSETNQPPVAETEPFTGPSLAFFTAMTNLQPETVPGLESVLANPLQRDYLWTYVTANQRSVVAGNTALEQAYAEGRAIGASLCPDARPKALTAFPAVVEAKPVTVIPVEAKMLGAQPSLFRPEVTESLFATHEGVVCSNAGCGFLGGVEEVVLHGQKGIQRLRDHGVPEETLGYLSQWVDEYRHLFANPSKLTAEEWAQVGGQMQAYINAKKNGGVHRVLYGIQAHGSDHFRVLGVIDNTGNMVKLESVPKLAGAAEFLNQPHELIETLVKGQRPGVNIVSASKLPPSALWPELAVPDEMFNIIKDAAPLTPELADELVAGMGYSTGALKQKGNMLFLVADTPQDMAVLRQALLRSSYYEEFIGSGGLLVEMMPDGQGLLQKKLVLRNLEHPEAWFTMTKAEKSLAKAGAGRLLGAAKIVSQPGGELMAVRVQSAADGKIYELSIPKNAGYSALTAETLEAAGLPAMEALWYEKALVGLGKVALFAGAVWMIYDGLKYGADVFGLGESVQLNGSGRDLDISDPELLQAISDLGLENSVAFRVKEGISLDKVAERLLDRKALFEPAAGLGIDKPAAYKIRLDDYAIGIPLVASDSDLATPIEVSASFESAGDQAKVAEIVYTHITTGETMVFRQDFSGNWTQTSGNANLNFAAVVRVPAGGSYSIPLKFFLDKGVEIVVPALDGISLRPE